MLTTQIHRCSICGTTGVWDKSWSWFGAIEDVEAKFCSDRCKSAFTPATVRNGVVWVSKC